MRRLVFCLAGLFALTGFSQAQSLANPPATGLPQRAMLVLQSDPKQAIGIKNYLLYLVPVKVRQRSPIQHRVRSRQCQLRLL